MKKKFLGIIAVFILSLFIIPSRAHATNGKTLTINMPNDTTNLYSALKGITLREYAAYDLLGEDNDILQPIMDGEGEDADTVGFEYKEGKDENSYIEVTDELRNASIAEIGRDIFEGYDKVSFKLYTPDANDSKELELDFTQLEDKDYLDMDVTLYEVVSVIGYIESDSLNEYITRDRVVTNKDGKVLATLGQIDDYWDYVISDDVTAEDDIIYEITEEVIEEFEAWYLDEYGEEYDEDIDYTRFVLRFSDEKYGETDLVYDFDNHFGDALKDFFEEKIAKEEKLISKVIFKNTEGKVLFTFYTETLKIEVAPNVSVKDNFTITLADDEFAEFIKELSDKFEKVSFVFSKTKNYKVLDGAKQKFDVSSKKALTFRFDIDFDTFKRSGKVYMDGKLVDAKNYTTKSGSTIVTFNDNYTNTLSQDNHTLKVTTDEGEATTTFTITDSVNNPNTGDNILMYVGLLSISVGSILVGLKLRKRFN